MSEIAVSFFEPFSLLHPPTFQWRKWPTWRSERETNLPMRRTNSERRSRNKILTNHAKNRQSQHGAKGIKKLLRGRSKPHRLLALPTSRRLRYQVRPTKLSLRFPKRPTMLLHQPLVRLGRTSLLIPSLSLRVAGFCARLHCPAQGSWVLINSRSI